MIKRLKCCYRARQARKRLVKYLGVSMRCGDFGLMVRSNDLICTGDQKAAQLLDDWAAKRNWKKPLSG